MNTRPKLDNPPDDNRPTERVELSEREVEILRLVATGVSNKEIAQRLTISPNTVKVHLRNIFAKIGAVSRTEATLYAIRHGWVQVDTPASTNTIEAAEDPSIAETVPPVPLSHPRRHPSRLRWIIAEVVALTLLLLTPLAWRAMNSSPMTPTVSVPPTATPLPRWQEKAPLPEARAGLAVAAYENMIYAMGGETATGVTGRLDRYNPTTDAWVTLTSKPISVTDVNAAVVGGLIYVPGGEMASGVVTSTMEAYDPRTDVWEQRAPLPVVLSAYALVVFEGKLYVVGGWNGDDYVGTTYEYDPGRDIWTERTPMPTARGYAGAATVGGKIYVAGGRNSNEALSTIEVYTPYEQTPEKAWDSLSPMPEARYAIGAAPVLDFVQILGGQSDLAKNLSFLEYLPRQDHWQATTIPIFESWSSMGVVPVETDIYVMGGLFDGSLTTRNISYHAVFTVMFPLVR